MVAPVAYRRKVINNSGTYLLHPAVADIADLLESKSEFLPYGQSATQLYPLGTVARQGDREWVYCLNGAAGLTAGVPVQSPAILHAETEAGTGVTNAAAAAGDYDVVVTSTANLVCAKDYFKDGYLTIADLAGEGHSYKIQTHAAFVGTNAITITLYDPLVVALTTASQWVITRCPYNQVVLTGAPLTGMYVGVAPRAVTAAYYFWAQRKGPCGVISKEAIAKGVMLCVGEAAGAVNDYTPVTTVPTIVNIMGRCMSIGTADTETMLAYLTY